jgi:hypothetical protein
MTDPMQQQLLGHLLGALDDDEQEHVDALLEYDETCCKEWLQWRRKMALLESMRPEFEPPPGLAKRTCQWVASYVSALASAGGIKKRMSDCPAPPSSVPAFGWPDLVATAFLFIFAAMLVLPAIQASQFQARLASCQERLRQFGLALTQYGAQQQDPVERFAEDGRLTRAGAVAVDWIRAGYFANPSQAPCPDAWLAAQGILTASLDKENALAFESAEASPTPNFAITTSADSRIPSVADMNPQNPWPGTWRDGTTDGRRLTSAPADVPLLADAPTADLLGAPTATHGGWGRNVLYDDGHTDFQPTATLHDAAPTMLLTAETPSHGISVPIVFVNQSQR